MDYWQIVLEHLLGQGFSEALLYNQCIDSVDAAQLTGLIQERRPRRTLEIGTFIGLSTGVIALSCPDSTLRVCVDPNFPVIVQSAEFGIQEERPCLFFARGLLEHFGKLEGTRFLEGYFSRTLDERLRAPHESAGVGFEDVPIVGHSALEFGPFDFVFHDGDHYGQSVESDLSLIHQNLSEDAIVVLHDLAGDWAAEVSSGVDAFMRGHDGYSFSVEGALGYLTRGGGVD